jgi:glutamate-5-semialdehyde dehydrogenase
VSAVEELARASKTAARTLASLTTAEKDRALQRAAAALKKNVKAIARVNAEDVAAAKKAKQTAAFIDRLTLGPDRIEAMARTVLEIAALTDPVGQITQTWSRPNGLEVAKVRLPLGVVLMIYESRPNVTADAAALCFKSGNAAILRGGSEAFRTNQAIARVLRQAFIDSGVPADAVQLVPDTRRETMLELLELEGLIDLCIPRGGEGLIRFVAEHARIPVVKHYQGVCHVYVEANADLKMAEKIIVNAKTSRPGVCNAAECLLVDRAIAEDFLPSAARALRKAGTELRGDDDTVRILKAAHVPVKLASPGDFGKEFLDLILAVKVVDDFDAALEHIARFGSEHTEAIVTRSRDAARRFTREVCASAVMVNASTRFNDGGELGLGAEVGISTTRLHAFGPMGLNELTSQKFVVQGDGQVR